MMTNDAYEAAADAYVAATLEGLAEAGITDAFVMDPGPGTVHVRTPEGTAFLSDSGGGIPGTWEPGWSVGYTPSDGGEEQEYRSGTGPLADGIVALIEAVRATR